MTVDRLVAHSWLHIVTPSEVDGMTVVLETRTSTYGENAETHFALLPVTNQRDEVVSVFLIRRPEVEGDQHRGFREGICADLSKLHTPS